MTKFKILDISGDVGIEAYGRTMKESFINASTGMYSLITDLNKVEERRTIELAVESDSPGGLLVSWLNELIFQFDAYGFIGKRADITAFPTEQRARNQEAPLQLKAVLCGEDFDPARHEGKLLIKAATYHKIAVKEKDGFWTVRMIFDI